MIPFRVSEVRRAMALLALAAITGLLPSALSGSELMAEFSGSAGVISPPFMVTNRCFVQTVNTGATNGGRAEFTFTLPAPTNCTVAIETKAESPEANTIYVNVDAEPAHPENRWEIPISPGFHRYFVPASVFGKTSLELGSGSHRLLIRGCEAGVWVSRVFIYTGEAPLPPKNLHTAGAPAAPSGLRVVSESQ